MDLQLLDVRDELILDFYKGPIHERDLANSSPYCYDHGTNSEMYCCENWCSKIHGFTPYKSHSIVAITLPENSSREKFSLLMLIVFGSVSGTFCLFPGTDVRSAFFKLHLLFHSID